MKTVSFIIFVFYVLCLSATSIMAAEKETASDCKTKRAAILVGPSDVKGAIYCISPGLSQQLDDTIRNEVRVGLSTGIADGLLHTERLDYIAELVEEVKNNIISKNVEDIDIIITSSGNIRNFDRLTEKIESKLSGSARLSSRNKARITISSTAKGEETAYGFLDALNTLLTGCNRPIDFANSIYINVSSTEVNLLYYNVSGKQFKYLQIPVLDAELSRLILNNPGKASVEKNIENYLGSDFDKLNLAKIHPDLFNKESRPNIYITGGTMWAMSGLIASENPDILKLLYASDTQLEQKMTQCYIEEVKNGHENKKNISLVSSDFSKAAEMLRRFQSIKNPVERRDELAKQLNKQLLHGSNTDKNVISYRKEDIGYQLTTYGYAQNQLLVQLTLVDWVLNLFGRNKCENGRDNECSITYINRQDNWARVYEYNRAATQDQALNNYKIVLPISKDISVPLSSVFESIKFIPAVSFRSRDMLR